MHFRTAAAAAALVVLSILGADAQTRPLPPCTPPANCTQQSPVDIAGAINAQLLAIEPIYPSGTYREYNDDNYTIKILPPAGAGLRVGTVFYPLKEFHFHYPSEHRIGGVPSRMEIHFVSEAPDGSAYVLGVMLDAGTPNKTFADIVAKMPPLPGKEHAVPVTLSPMTLLPADRKYWTYMGSLTTPPYSETVRWFVLKTPGRASVAEIDRYPLKDSARGIQPINRRFILSH
jgi:carbonic anhydrase